MSSVSRAQLLQMAHAFVESYNSFTVDALLSVRSPSCTHHTLPTNDKRFPPRSNDEYGTFVQPFISTMRDFRLMIVNEDEITVDVERRKVVFYARSHTETDVGEYANEYVFTLSMSADGKSVDKVIEFFDSAYLEKFFARLAGQSISTSA